jgi:small subunit ribosomal protein S20
MANVKSAEKRNRQNIKRRARNNAARAKVKTVSQKALDAIRANAKGATDVIREATSVLAKAAARGTIPKGRMARKISRIMKAQNKAATAAK